MDILDKGLNARLVRKRPWMISPGESAGGGGGALFVAGVLQGAAFLQNTSILGVM